MERALELLKLVKINDPERRLKAYPHELSGGMAQRIMIAMALINNPRVIIADDCTNGLDVTVAAQIMDLFQGLMETQHSSGIMITHDLGIVAQCCTHIAIIYSGQIIETAKVTDFFAGCRHPYSQMLLDSLPENIQKTKQPRISGIQNDPYSLPDGCLFYARCPYRQQRCGEVEPQERLVGSNHIVKCHYPL